MSFIVQYHQRCIVITRRRKKLYIMNNKSYKLCNFDVSAVFYETDVPYVSLYVISLNETHPHLYYQTHIPWYKRTMGNTNYQNRNNTSITSVCCHTCALVTCIRSLIYRILIGSTIDNRGIQPLLVALRRKL
jgi:hypothetical protein